MSAGGWLAALAAVAFDGGDGMAPRAMLAAAVADAEAAPAKQRPELRYVSFANLPFGERALAAAALSLTLNSVSRASSIVRPAPVPDTQDALWRWRLSDYAPRAADRREFAAAYEGLAAEDPWWHVRAEPASADKRRAAPRPSLADAPWLDLALAARLRLLTGSRGALARGDWLIARLSAPPHYYRFAGIPEERSRFEASLGLDGDKIAALQANHGANMFRSQITRKPRRLSRWQGPLGGAWNTYDLASVTPEKDPFRDPTAAFRFDAGEHIAAKANGLHLFALFDAQGKRVDEVPPEVAKDDSEPLGDGIVRPMISCVRCHVEDGLRPFANDQRALLAGRVDLFAADAATAEKLASFYGDARLERQLERDREDYRAAVERATGLAPARAAAALGQVVRAYEYDLVDAPTAIRELGLPAATDGGGSAATLRQALAATTDPILLALCEGLAVQRQQWEASYPAAATLAALRYRQDHTRRTEETQ